MSERSKHRRTSPSLHSSSSYPDPADEDVLVKGSRESGHRPSITKRQSSYTTFLTTRNFTPELYREARWSARTTRSRTPSVRAPSETASTTDDWRTALNGSLPERRSEVSQSRSRSHSEEEIFGRTEALQPLSPVLSPRKHAHVPARQNPSSKDKRTQHETDILDVQGNLRTPQRQVSHKLSAANLQRQLQLQEENMVTPQPNTRQSIPEDVKRLAAPLDTSDVRSELEQLRKRLDSLEHSVPTRIASPFSPFTSSGPAGKIRPRTSESLGVSSLSPIKGYRNASASPGEHQPLLRDALNALRTTGHLSSDLLRPLDLAVTDALALASLSEHPTARARAGGLCRSLTTLCIELQRSFNRPPDENSPKAFEGRARSRTFEALHSRQQSISGTKSLSRKGSTRRSLAELLAPEHEYKAESAVKTANRSLSRMSRVTDDRASIITKSEYDDSRSERLPASSRPSSIYSSASVFAQSRQGGPLHHAERHGQTAKDSSGEDWLANRHARAPSRAATEVLERLPVTREALYARYRRSP